ncbi:magnesium/cobalt transporter CorA [Anoxybacillus sp. J5B_2022]|uniref:magnesium/cobalt transporter CorA n=1 Tax=Anoxybacillus sp. J5B_2022 TaxID=3003246 RepID=UPI002285B439|nr:magnesium/cobalt transporter CorA [Anoxybacillus sp. J5B_2022]MCZ0754289.1 magnesium/cobalt transporter CorA [Anoxybacillus sp. J5B_2022]
MIRTCGVTKDFEVVYDLPLQMLKNHDISWYWVDFHEPTDEEAKLLADFFQFHPLAIEDCLEYVQRPKLDFYEQYLFIVLHSINQKTLEAEEVDVFVGQNFIVTFHKQSTWGINQVWERLKTDESFQIGPFHVFYRILDKLVDDYFPPLYHIEDVLNDLEENTQDETIQEIIEKVFDIRSDLSKLRRTIVPMRDLLYRIINSDRLQRIKEQHIYFHDIYDHLLKLVEMIEANREITSDIRDSYLSLNSNRMNTIMMTLTVITTIFMPLTFIVGIYGMNFDYMPELHWKYGYFTVLGVMALIAAAMFLWFKKNGWFRFHKGNR